MQELLIEVAKLLYDRWLIRASGSVQVSLHDHHTTRDRIKVVVGLVNHIHSSF